MLLLGSTAGSAGGIWITLSSLVVDLNDRTELPTAHGRDMKKTEIDGQTNVTFSVSVSLSLEMVFVCRQQRT